MIVSTPSDHILTELDSPLPGPALSILLQIGR
jgi:hypothetical protein